MNKTIVEYFDELKKKKKSLTFSILLHDNPDPDALACGMGVRFLLESFGHNSQIFWHGELTHIQNRILYNVLKIDAIKTNSQQAEIIEEKSKGSKIIVVDSSNPLGTGNMTGIGSFFSGRSRDLVIDHHSGCCEEGVYFNKNHGSCSTTVYELIKSYGLEINRTLATAFIIGIDSDTDNLRKKGTTETDKEIRDELMEKIDPEKYLRIINYPKPVSTICLRSNIYSSLKKEGDIAFCNSGIILPEQRSLVAEIADEILRIETIKHCCIISIINPGENQKKALSVSFRNTGDVIDTNDFMKAVFGPEFGGREGSGGGSTNLDDTLSLMIDKALFDENKNSLKNLLDLIGSTYFSKVVSEKAKIS